MLMAYRQVVRLMSAARNRSAGVAAGAGQPGNAVLVGHVASRNSGKVFRDPDKVQVGDLVQVSSGRQQFDYRVVDVGAVARTDVAAVRARTDGASILLITCTGVWLP